MSSKIKNKNNSNFFIFSLFILFLSFLIYFLPLSFFILSSMKLKEEYKPQLFLKNIKEFNDTLPTKFQGYFPSIIIGPQNFLLIIQPSQELFLNKNNNNNNNNNNKNNNIFNINDVIDWYDENKEWFDNMISKYGGILLRNFNVNTPIDFDNFIGHLHPDITTDIYLGTTPRFRVNGTRYIFTASEAPKFVSIPTHIELSFSPSPPQRIYFYADVVNPSPGGQTPLTDFREVWRQLSPTLKEKITRKGLVYERWYRHEKNPANDPLVHKTWQAMFLTSDKETVKRMALEQGYNSTWDENDDLLLKHHAVITRINKQTNTEFWCTHFNVLHAATVAVPYAWDAQILQSKRSAFVALLFHFWVQGRKLLGYHYGANTLYGDDESELKWDEAMHIREIISKNTWIYDYEENDVVMIDNHRLAHGRTPWMNGKRSVLVAYH